MTARLIGLFALLCLLLCPVTASAFLYNESTHGDISWQSFAFDMGDNVIAGHSNVDNSTLGASDSDNFHFSLPDGGAITSITYEHFNVTGDARNELSTVFGTELTLKDSSYSPSSEIDSKLLQIYPAEGAAPALLDIMGDLLPVQPALPSGMLTWTNEPWWVAGIPAAGSWDYITTFTVKPASAPEPASLALLGLGGLTVLRRRR